jgi:hypothetical protein
MNFARSLSAYNATLFLLFADIKDSNLGKVKHAPVLSRVSNTPSIKLINNSPMKKLVFTIS